MKRRQRGKGVLVPSEMPQNLCMLDQRYLLFLEGQNVCSTLLDHRQKSNQDPG